MMVLCGPSLLHECKENIMTKILLGGREEEKKDLDS